MGDACSTHGGGEYNTKFDGEYKRTSKIEHNIEVDRNRVLSS
jgi:hypothetical protein